MRTFAQPQKRASSASRPAHSAPLVLPSPGTGRQAVQRILYPHGAAVGLSEAPSVLRRAVATEKTSAGEFVADPYDATLVQGARGITTGYGADIKITFKANENVDAEKIALVQTARSVMDGKVQNIYHRDPKEKKVNESRMIPAGKPGAGTHIDQLPRSRTPLYGVTQHRGDALSEPEPSNISTIGWRYKDGQGKLQEQDASMRDTPDLNSGDNYTKASDVMKQEWSQTFETAAVAIAGRQKGTFYGSVHWGWRRGVSDQVTRLAFGKKSDSVASPVFMEAAKLWNASETTKDQPTIDLPVNAHVYYDGAWLWDRPKGNTIATLNKDTPLARTAKVDPQGRTWWTHMVVTGGPNAGMTGWVRGMDLHYER